MRTVNVHEAKTHLSRLLEAVEAGEQVVIARAGKPVAQLVPASAAPQRHAGTWAGRIVIHDGFDEADGDIVTVFEEGEISPTSQLR